MRAHLVAVQGGLAAGAQSGGGGGGPADPPLIPRTAPPPSPPQSRRFTWTGIGRVRSGWGRRAAPRCPTASRWVRCCRCGVGGGASIEGPPKRPGAPPGGGGVTIPYLVASSATSTWLSSTEQLNSNSSVKSTWGGGEGVKGSGGGGGGFEGGFGGSRLLPWPWSGTRGTPRCRAADAPPALCTPTSPRCRPAGSGTAWGGAGGGQGREWGGRGLNAAMGRSDGAEQRGLICQLGSVGPIS